MPTDNFKLLHQSQITTTAGALYTVPASHETIVKYITVANNDTEALWFTLFHTTGTTYNETTTIIPEATIPLAAGRVQRHHHDGRFGHHRRGCATSYRTYHLHLWG